MGKPVALSDARRRILLYMRDHRIVILRCGWSTAYTVDQYQWPVSGMVVNALIAAGLLERDPASNEHEFFRLSDAGLTAIDLEESKT